MPRRFLTREETRVFDNRFGRKQDLQHWYESHATWDLLKHGGFETPPGVFELGFGTGTFVEKVLKHDLPKTARYCGVAISSTMLERTLSLTGVSVKICKKPGKVFPVGDEQRF